MAVAGVVVIARNSLALAFSLAGVVGAVRFRNVLPDTRDTLYVLVAIGVGLAAGVDALAAAAVLSMVFNFLALLLWKYDYGLCDLGTSPSHLMVGANAVSNDDKKPPKEFDAVLLVRARDADTPDLPTVPLPFIPSGSLIRLKTECRMTTMADVLTPLSWRRGEAARWVLDATLVLAGSLLVALSAQVAIVLPFTPVPITGQTFAVLLVGAVLGSRRGALAMVAYLAEGAAGLPVFSAGACCVPWLLGPTAGFLWSYPLVAFAVGALAERGWDRSPIRAGIAMLAGNALIYLVALPWLALFVGAGRVLETGLLPFIPGDLLKVVLAALALPGGWALIGAARRSKGDVDE